MSRSRYRSKSPLQAAALTSSCAPVVVKPQKTRKRSKRCSILSKKGSTTAGQQDNGTSLHPERCNSTAQHLNDSASNAKAEHPAGT